MTIIHSLYNLPDDLGVTFTEPSMAQQHFKDECDINRIIDRFTKTGTIPQIISGFEFADLSNVPSYQEAMGFLIEAQDRFMELPAKIRREFDNDPGQLLTFLENPSNYDKAVELGLIQKQDHEMIAPPLQPYSRNETDVSSSDEEGRNTSASPK